MTDAALEEAPRLNRRQQAKAATRAKVLKAARTLFAEVGYAATGIRDIADGAGMSTGAVFANFPDKAAVWRAAMDAPAPDARLADEIALALGRFPDASIGFRKDGDGLWTATVAGVEPEQRGSGRAPWQADALHRARLEAMARAGAQGLAR